MKSFKTVDQYITSSKAWKEELILLREILNDSGLSEEVKWGAPVYTHNGKNIAGIAAFKSYVGLWFHQGALLKNVKKKLINAQEGKTKALRQWRFAAISEIDAKLVRSYIREAIKNSEAGVEIKPTKKPLLATPPELMLALKRNKELNKAFQKLTGGKQQEYIEYIVEAVRQETKAKRVKKIIPLVVKGIGLNDKYKKA